MARRRMIHPTIWDDEDVGMLSDGAFRFFIACISNADDDGKLEASARRMRAIAFKYSDSVSIEQTEEYLQELSAKLRSFCRYTVDGREYVKLLKWRSYQEIHKCHYKASTLPEPDENSINSECIPYAYGTDTVSVQYDNGNKVNKVNKVNISKVSNIPAPFGFSTASDVEQAYLKRMAKMPPPGMRRAFKELEQEFDPEYIIAAINFYADRQEFKKITPAYIKGTLNGRRADGTLDELLPPKPKVPSGLPPGTVVARLEAEMKARERARNGS